MGQYVSKFDHGDWVEVDFNNIGRIPGRILKIEFTPTQVFYDIEVETTGEDEHGEQFFSNRRLYHINEGHCRSIRFKNGIVRHGIIKALTKINNGDFSGAREEIDKVIFEQK